MCNRNKTDYSHWLNLDKLAALHNLWGIFLFAFALL